MSHLLSPSLVARVASYQLSEGTRPSYAGARADEVTAGQVAEGVKPLARHRISDITAIVRPSRPQLAN